jgi:hypothetical protein
MMGRLHAPSAAPPRSNSVAASFGTSSWISVSRHMVTLRGIAMVTSCCALVFWPSLTVASRL